MNLGSEGGVVATDVCGLPSPVLQREASTLRDTTKAIILKWGLLP